MFCTKCGARVAEGAKFCGNCANPVDAAADGQQQESVPYSPFSAGEPAAPFEPSEPAFGQKAGAPQGNEGTEFQRQPDAGTIWGTQPIKIPPQGPDNSPYPPYSTPAGQNNGYQNPYGYQQPWNMPPQPPRKSKKGLIIAISVSVVVILLVIAAVWASGIISSKPYFSELKMASEIDQQTSKPITLTDTFTPDTPVIYLTGVINKAKEGTRIKGIWRHIDTGDKVEGQELQVKGSYRFNFHLQAPDGGFQEGRYEIIMYINDEEVDRVAFKVEGNGESSVQEETTQQETTQESTQAEQVTLSNLTPTEAVNDKSEPTAETGTFTSNVPTIYVAGIVNNATSGTKLKAVWTHKESKSTVESPELNVDGTRWFNFYLTKPETSFPAGHYVVVLSIDGKEAGRVQFQVAAEETGNNQPDQTDSTKNVTVTQLNTYTGVDNQGKPSGEAKSTFTNQDEAVYVVGIINNAPKGTKIKAVWFHKDSGDNVEAPTLTVEGSRWFNFYLKKPEQGFTSGSYLVKIYINNAETNQITFKIQ